MACYQTVSCHCKGRPWHVTGHATRLSLLWAARINLWAAHINVWAAYINCVLYCIFCFCFLCYPQCYSFVGHHFIILLCQFLNLYLQQHSYVEIIYLFLLNLLTKLFLLFALAFIC